MSDKMRWRYGDTNPVVAAVDAETVIEIGDLLWLDDHSAKPASQPLDQSDPDISMRERFARKFLGVSMQHSRSGDTDPVRVAATGVFEFDCPNGTFELGDLIGIVKDSSGMTLLNQQVDLASNSACAIARVAKREPGATIRVLIDIRSMVMTGGI